MSRIVLHDPCGMHYLYELPHLLADYILTATKLFNMHRYSLDSKAIRSHFETKQL